MDSLRQPLPPLGHPRGTTEPHGGQGENRALTPREPVEKHDMPDRRQRHIHLVLQPHLEISVWSRLGRETATAVIVWVCWNQTIGGGRAAHCRRCRPGWVG